MFERGDILFGVTFLDFIGHFYSALKKGVPTGLGVPPELAPLGTYNSIRALVEQAHVLHLESPEDEAAFMKEVGRDALEDLQATLPVPFDNFAIVQEEGIRELNPATRTTSGTHASPACSPRPLAASGEELLKGSH